MESSTARTETAKTDPRSDSHASSETEARPAVEYARQALDKPRLRAAESPFEVLDEILDEIRAMRRERNFSEFSIAQLAGAVAQAFAICAVCFGLYWAINGDANSSTLALLTAIVFQIMALTGFMISKRR